MIVNFVSKENSRQHFPLRVPIAQEANTKIKTQLHRLNVRRVVKGSMHLPKTLVVLIALLVNFKIGTVQPNIRARRVLRGDMHLPKTLKLDVLNVK